MSRFEFDASGFFNHLSAKEQGVIGALETTMHDSTDDLKRISSEIAPIKSSSLRKSVDAKVDTKPESITGEVSFNVTEESGSGRFDYALWIHEMDYKLGDQSAASPGTDGYAVGSKYLERPLKGESEKYVNWWAKGMSKVMDR